MADMMMFPNTVEEFMEKYKITDAEQVYTNGADLVPIFRMRQWFEHAADVAPVRHGRWVKMTGMMPPEYHGHYECSLCGWHGHRNIREREYSYCPNCGAKMDGDENV